MSNYQITFKGREVGAIGKFYPIMENVKAETENDAVKKLYNKYDLFMWPNDIVKVKSFVKGSEFIS